MILGEIQKFTTPSVPVNYVECDGRILTIRLYPDLYNLIGYTYGGSGEEFAIPDLRPRDVNNQIIKLNNGDWYNGTQYIKSYILIKGGYVPNN